MGSGRGRAVEHRHLLSAIAESRVPIWHVGLCCGDHWRHLLQMMEVGRMERGERRGPLRTHPAHTRPELTDGINGEFHERERGLVSALDSARNVDGHEPASNLLNGGHGQAAKIGRTNLGKETLHQQSHSVQVSDGNQRIGRGLVRLEVSDWNPEKPSPQGLEALKLLGNGKSGADLTRTLEKADQVLHLSGVFLVVLQMSFHLDDLLEGSLIGLNVILTRLGGPMFGVWRSRSGWEGAALSNEVRELRLMLPLLHSINHLAGGKSVCCDADVLVKGKEKRTVEVPCISWVQLRLLSESWSAIHCPYKNHKRATLTNPWPATIAPEMPQG